MSLSITADKSLLVVYEYRYRSSVVSLYLAAFKLYALMIISNTIYNLQSTIYNPQSRINLFDVSDVDVSDCVTECPNKAVSCLIIIKIPVTKNACTFKVKSSTEDRF